MFGQVINNQPYNDSSSEFVSKSKVKYFFHSKKPKLYFLDYNLAFKGVNYREILSKSIFVILDRYQCGVSTIHHIRCVCLSQISNLHLPSEFLTVNFGQFLNGKVNHFKIFLEGRRTYRRYFCGKQHSYIPALIHSLLINQWANWYLLIILNWVFNLTSIPKLSEKTVKNSAYFISPQCRST